MCGNIDMGREKEERRIFTRKQKQVMAERQDYSCGRCGNSFWRESLSVVEAHHIWPFSKGGITKVSNGVVLCPECHKIENDAVIRKGVVYGGDGYTPADIQRVQKRKGW